MISPEFASIKSGKLLNDAQRDMLLRLGLDPSVTPSHPYILPDEPVEMLGAVSMEAQIPDVMGENTTKPYIYDDDSVFSAATLAKSRATPPNKSRGRRKKPATKTDMVSNKQPNNSNQSAPTKTKTAKFPCGDVDPEIFFPRKKNSTKIIEAAKKICTSCAAVTICADQAIRTREPYGIWGGVTEWERQALFTKQAQADQK